MFIYKKKFLVILMAISKWRHYLEYDQFIIKTNNESLKYLLEQRIHNLLSFKRINKLMVMRYIVHYRQGKENIMDDALSKRVIPTKSCHAMLAMLPNWIKEI